MKCAINQEKFLNKIYLLVFNQVKVRIVLLASGGHFAGCVFDGDAVVAHTTFHREIKRRQGTLIIFSPLLEISLINAKSCNVPSESSNPWSDSFFVGVQILP
ncbi:hypothetical protein HN51_012597 [Arachis hypogaea]